MIDFIIYDKAGNGRALKAKNEIQAKLDELGEAYKFHEAHNPGDATVLASELCSSGTTMLVAVGGDGTVHEILNGIKDFSRVAFGIIPAGTGNDFATALGIPSSPLAALDVILKKRVITIDFFECSGIRGLNIAGTGIDVDILRHYDKAKLFKGKIQYLFSLIHCLLRYKPYTVRLKDADGNIIEKQVFIVCACNGSQFGGGIRICPAAVIGDGLLDVVLVNDMPKRKTLGAFIKLMKGKVLTIKGCEYSRVSEIALEGTFPVQIDGEIYDNLPFRVKVMSNMLRMLVPEAQE